MDKLYFELVVNGKRTCDKENTSVPMVPEKHLATVLAMLEKDGRDANGELIV